MALFSNVVVVPDYPSNAQLASRITEQLSRYIDQRSFNPMITPPKIVIFRPTGRPGDEFREAVMPVLNDRNDVVFLFVAFSGQAKNIADLVPYSVQNIKRTETIFIQSGHLVPESSQKHDVNQQAFQKMAQELIRQYNLTDRMPMEENARWKTSMETVALILVFLGGIIMAVVVFLLDFTLACLRKASQFGKRFVGRYFQ